MKNKKYLNNSWEQFYEIESKEVAKTKDYIKKVWGEPTPLKGFSYRELRVLGEELGVDISHRKNFNLIHNTHGQKRLKYYSRSCRKCKKDYKIPVDEKKSRPKGPSVCPECKKKNYLKLSKLLKGKKIKIITPIE